MPDADATLQLEASYRDAIERAAAPLRASGFGASIAFVLGSGQGALVEAGTIRREIPFAAIEGFVPPSVKGHAGRLVQLALAGHELLLLDGRLHLYEGRSYRELLFGIGILQALGCRTLVLANAAGGLHPQLRRGDLMVLSDLIDLHLGDPLRGIARQPERFHARPFDAQLARELLEAGARAGLPLRAGCYASVFGPNYETAAEVRMLRILGADAVGMSTAPEASFAHALGLRVGGISCITNVARESAAEVVSHAEVVQVAGEGSADFAKLVRSWLESL